MHFQVVVSSMPRQMRVFSEPEFNCLPRKSSETFPASKCKGLLDGLPATKGEIKSATSARSAAADRLKRAQAGEIKTNNIEGLQGSRASWREAGPHVFAS